MASKNELLQLLKNRSHTHGWGAIAVFDGAFMAQRLADHYSLSLHGSASIKPIDADKIDIAEGNSDFATLEGIVLEAPRISFISHSLQGSRMRVTYRLAKGLYTEHSESIGQAERVYRIVNAGAGRTYTFSFDVDISAHEGVVGKYGEIKLVLTLGTGKNPQCDLGSHDTAQRKVSEFLLDEINARYAVESMSKELLLGCIETTRGHTLPRTFMVRTQAKPGTTTGEGALVVLISHPNGERGLIPVDTSFPYLIPDDASAENSATLLVAPTYPSLMDGEAEALFGQLLFPKEAYFSTVERHTDTVDTVVFGRLPRFTPAQRAVRPLLNTPGIAAQVVTREVGRTAQAVIIQASSDSSQVWNWQLETDGLGSLEANGASAVYTPPLQLAGDEKVAVQRVIANRAASGEYQEVCIVLQAGPNQATVTPPVIGNCKPGSGMLIEASNPYAGDPDLRESWTVVGEGSVSNGDYVAPAAPRSDIDVVVYNSWLEKSSSIIPLAFGYCIVQFDKTVTPPHWQRLTLRLKAAQTGARPYANGMQQFAIIVTWNTYDGPPLMPEELQTLRLVFSDGREVPLLPNTIEGLTQPDAGSDDPVTRWAFRTEPNSFTGARAPTRNAVKAAPKESRDVTFYLHTLDVLPAKFAVRLTDINNGVHTSTDSEGSEQDEVLLTVTPQPVPQYSAFNFEIKRKRVEGGYTSDDPSEPIGTPEEPNFKWHFTTVDYWNYQLLFNGERVAFVRLQWEEDGPGVRWGSQKPGEDGFSYLGYLLNPIIRQTPEPTHLRYATALYNPILYNKVGFDGEVPHSKLYPGERGDLGTLLISLNREVGIYYRQKALIPGFNLERPFVALLWDQYGTRHRIQFEFESDLRNKITIAIKPN